MVYAKIDLDSGVLRLLVSLLSLAVAGSLCLGLAGLSLLLDLLLLDRLGLHLVDALHEVALSLELVTLGLHVKLTVHELINLLGLTVLLQKTAENALAAHPEDLEGETSVGRTLAATVAGVAALALGLVASDNTCAGVNHVGLLDHQAILDELAHGLSRVGRGDVCQCARVEPNLALAALEHGRRKALLKLESCRHLSSSLFPAPHLRRWSSRPT